MADEHPAAAIWPPARLRIRTGNLELRLPRDEELVQLADLAARGVHDPATMPFESPWTDVPDQELRRNLYAWHASNRSSSDPDAWALLLGVFESGQVVGAQDIGARRFAVRRTVASGSWVGREHQGRGIGTTMRRAVLHFAFDSLGALEARSGAYVDNPGSNRVSERCGYEPDGTNVRERRRGETAPGGASSERVLEQRWRITREQWLRLEPLDVQVTGLDDELRAMLGAAASD